MNSQNEDFNFLDHFSDAAAIIDSGRVLCRINSAFETLLGYQESTLLGRSLADICKKNLSANISKSPEAIDFLTVNGKNLTMDCFSSKISINGLQYIQIMLQPMKYPERNRAENQIALQEEAIDTWKIGIFEYSHIDDKFYISPFLRKLHGLSEEELLDPQIIMSTVFELDKEMVSKAIEHSSDPAGDGVLDVVHRIVHDDGKVFWIHVRSQTRFRDVNGEMIAIFTSGTVMDVTDQQVLERQIVRNEERLTQAIELSKVGIFEHDHILYPTGHKIYWSPMCREILGADPDTELGLDWFLGNIHPEDRECFASELGLSHKPEEKGDFKLEYRWLHSDGKVRWLSTSGRTFFVEIDGIKTIARSVGGVIDITERKEFEEERERHTAILEATPDFVSITDTEGNLIYLNQAGRTLLGFTVDEDISNQHMSLAHTQSSLSVLESEGLYKLFNTGVWVSESEFISFDGRVLPMSQVLLVHRNNKGEMEYISTIARDLTKEKSLEAQFQQAHKMEAIGRLAGGIAHDFNNMLSVIMGFTSLAVDKIGLDHEANEELDEVRLAAERAAALTGQLLSFSRKQIFRLQVIDINQVLQGMEPMLKRLVNESIHMSVEPSSQESHIKVDPNQMEQVFLNLVVNASDSMPEGGNLSIAIHQVVFDEGFVEKQVNLSPGAYVEITITDTGKGMNSVTREKVFEPFFTTKGVGQGTGLGLATVFGIVTQSGGGILLDSVVGKGTVFKLYFPKSEEELTLEDEEAFPIETTRSHAGKVVLVVEDESQVKSMIVTCLKNAGYTVLSAEDPKSALQLAKNHHDGIDLLLTDVVMPDMTGKELAGVLLKERPNTLVLYMSGYTEDSIVKHGVLNSDVNFIAKPITPRGLLVAVEKVLNKTAELKSL